VKPQDNTLRVIIFFTTAIAADQRDKAAEALGELTRVLAEVNNQFTNAGHLVTMNHYGVRPEPTGEEFDLVVLVGGAGESATLAALSLGRPVLVISAAPDGGNVPMLATSTAESAYSAAQELRRRFAKALLGFGPRLPGVQVSEVPPIASAAPRAPVPPRAPAPPPSGSEV
jgi:hypothetical protein